MAQNTVHDDRSVDDYVASLDDETAAETRVLVDLMTRVSGLQPQLWNVGTIGFGTYHYRYASGREGDCHTLGFYPRRRKLTIYLMDGTERHADLLARLGPHTTSRVCVYLTRLDGIDLAVLEQVLRESQDYLRSQDGHMHRA